MFRRSAFHPPRTSATGKIIAAVNIEEKYAHSQRRLVFKKRAVSGIFSIVRV